MAWLLLLVSAVCEAVWATALGRSDNFTNPTATTVFVVALILSMIGLAGATRSIAIGTAYAIWTGLGAALTVGYGIVTGTESASPAKLVFLGGIIAAAVGLKMLPAQGAERSEGAGRV